MARILTISQSVASTDMSPDACLYLRNSEYAEFNCLYWFSPVQVHIWSCVHTYIILSALMR